MVNREDPFSGTWKLNSEKSQFDPNHRPLQATMCFERDPKGYRMTAEGVKEGGQAVRERPQLLHPDGVDYPVPDAPGVTAVCTRPDSSTIRVEARSGGQIVGQATYVVSADGTALTATVQGTDAQQRPFQTLVVFDRQP